MLVPYYKQHERKQEEMGKVNRISTKAENQKESSLGRARDRRLFSKILPLILAFLLYPTGPANSRSPVPSFGHFKRF
jgi:hypothetical protein